MILVPKTKDRCGEKNYHFNSVFKHFLQYNGKYRINHVIQNKIWDKGQQGSVLGAVNQVFVDRCIMEEVITYQRNLAVLYYDYKKTYDNGDYDWILHVYKWIGIHQTVISLL